MSRSRLSGPHRVGSERPAVSQAPWPPLHPQWAGSSFLVIVVLCQ
ncbi:hypothetical protein Cadr_000026585 [Camelus dromedarius]|uniref:Uncharacterized protein n=1 Tax=Camelus dromedarius TaxID=9838 RepID=A0A5N4CFN2_CAMDR|nr:hypothetical protein Cadr_000026585 [Camelus dromedarius]